MYGFTLSEISEKLGIPVNTLRQRMTRAGIKPITKEAIYSESAIEAIRVVNPVGWPKKPPKKNDTGEGD